MGLTVFGRTAERSTIDALLGAVRRGDSRALMLRGEPGIGKSVLLEYAATAAATAEGMRVLRCSGVESELDLAYAGLHQLLRPVAAMTAELPEGQRHAVRTALGLGQAPAADRFFVGAGVLSLLSGVAERQPVLCLIDDAQWIDPASAGALAFAARRLGSEGIGVLAATREVAWSGLPELPVGGLGQEAGQALARAVDDQLSDEECARLVQLTGGNPLALRELAGAAGQVLEYGPVPLTDRLLGTFSTGVGRLSASAGRLLLIVAADDSAELAVIGRAAHCLDVPVSAWDEALRTELVRIDGETVAFGHPLVRAAVYHGADLSERLAAHRALAEAVQGQLGRRAWHLAAAAVGPNEQVATELERSGEHARLRGGHGSAATAFARAAELSLDARYRGQRFTSAAVAAYDAGDLERAQTYARRANPLIDDPRERGQLTHLLARIELIHNRPATAHPLFLDAATLAASSNPEHAALTLSEAMWAAQSTGELRNIVDVVAAFTALRLPSDHPLVTAHVGLGEFLTGGRETGLARIRRGIDALVQPDPADRVQPLANTALAGLVLATGDHAAGIELGRAAVTHCRTSAVAGRLPLELAALASIEMFAERQVSARTHATEAMALARDLGQDHPLCVCQCVLAVLGAVQGNEVSRGLVDEAARAAEQAHLTLVTNAVPWALGLLELSLGKAQRAVEHFAEAQRRHDQRSWPFPDIIVMPDFIEAAARAGTPGRAAESLERFEDWANHSKQPWAQAVLHRGRALLSFDDDTIEHHYQTAIGLHQNAGPDDRPFSGARTRLLYGEWLRRKRRRTHARPHLLAAHDAFTQLDATAWARRAEAELRATGETIPHPNIHTTTRLTPQELQVVRLAAEGGTNRDIAAQLYLSPRTVGYHLSKAFRKLNITSRHELTRLPFE